MTPDRVQRTYLVLLLLQTLAASLIWGINTLFLLDAGLSITEAFVANAAFTAGMVIFEVPTGVIADTFGRRTSFILGAATLLVTTAAYLGLWYVQAGIGWWILVSALIGLGFTFFSGATGARPWPGRPPSSAPSVAASSARSISACPISLALCSSSP
jgi:MFS family permease